jgi:hypothetical protein
MDKHHRKTNSKMAAHKGMIVIIAITDWLYEELLATYDYHL